MMQFRCDSTFLGAKFGLGDDLMVPSYCTRPFRQYNLILGIIHNHSDRKCSAIVYQEGCLWFCAARCTEKFNTHAQVAIPPPRANHSQKRSHFWSGIGQQSMGSLQSTKSNELLTSCGNHGDRNANLLCSWALRSQSICPRHSETGGVNPAVE